MFMVYHPNTETYVPAREAFLIYVPNELVDSGDDLSLLNYLHQASLSTNSITYGVERPEENANVQS